MKIKILYFGILVILLNSCKNEPKTYNYQYEVEISDEEYNDLLTENISELYYDTYYSVIGSSSKFSQSVSESYPCKAKISISPKINNYDNNQIYRVIIEFQSERAAPGNRYVDRNEYLAKIRLDKSESLHKYELYEVKDALYRKVIDPIFNMGEYEGNGYFNSKEFWLKAEIMNYKFEQKRTKTISELRTRED